MRGCALLLIGVAGCLSTPGPAGGADGGDDDGGGTDAAVDAAGTARCRRDARPAGQTWPPADIVVRSVLLADVDGDSVGDLVVSAAPFDPALPGASKIFVLYGPVSPAAPQYHVEVDLDLDLRDAELQPVATSLDDLDGDTCLDLTVFGPPTLGNANSRVVLFQHTGSALPWDVVSARRTIDFEPFAQGPVMAAWGDLSLGESFDLAIADLNNVRVLGDSSLAFLGSPVTVPPPASCGTWDNINALAMQDAPTVRQRLLVFGHYRTNTVAIDDGGIPVVSDNCTPASAPITRGTTPVDLDGMPPLDLLSGGGGQLGAHLLAGNTPVTTPMTGLDLCPATPRGTDNYIEGFAAGDLGGTTAPDVVVIDYDDEETPTPGSYACLVNAVAADGTAVTANGNNEVRIGDGRVRSLAVGDAGGGVRAWIFDLDGRLRCLKRSVGTNALVPC